MLEFIVGMLTGGILFFAGGLYTYGLVLKERECHRGSVRDVGKLPVVRVSDEQAAAKERARRRENLP